MKKTVLSLISVSLVFVMLFALVACGGSSIEGTYYNADKSESFKLKGGEWTASASGIQMTGTYKVDGNKVTFYMDLLGEEVEAFSGTVDGNTITVEGEAYTK